jgi:hypothetical protein
MLSLYRLSQWASHNSEVALKKASDACTDRAGMQRALTAPPSTRLMQACRKNGPTGLTGKWESLFFALPERLLASLSYFIGNTKSATGRPAELPADIAVTLEQWRTGGIDPCFDGVRPENLATIESILLCHGLSPVGDSLLLLADLGRAHRVSSALGLPIAVMLTAVDWQKDNRSLLQLPTLSALQAEQALVGCQERRLKLYAKLGISSRPFATDRGRLEEISNFYRTLAGELWQVNTTGSLSVDQQRAIAGALPAELELKHKQDLRVLRFFAKQFNGFDPEYFWYFLNQYFAQQEFQGNSLKVAVESEEKFDRNFQELNDCLAIWSESPNNSRADALPVVYLPQYKSGTLRILPYTPLSLDVMKQEAVKQDHRQIHNYIVSLDEDQNVESISKLLAQTPLGERNRLVADLLSFLTLSGQKLGMPAVEKIGAAAGICLASVLSAISAEAAFVFEQELAVTSPERFQTFWAAGLESALTEVQPQLVPLPLASQLFEEQDWHADRTTAFAQLCHLCRAIYTVIVS